MARMNFDQIRLLTVRDLEEAADLNSDFGAAVAAVVGTIEDSPIDTLNRVQDLEDLIDTYGDVVTHDAEEFNSSGAAAAALAAAQAYADGLVAGYGDIVTHDAAEFEAAGAAAALDYDDVGADAAGTIGSVVVSGTPATGKVIKATGAGTAEWAEEAAAGTGLGDLLSTNNLSDLDDIAEARDNLGLGSVSQLAEDVVATQESMLLANESINYLLNTVSLLDSRIVLLENSTQPPPPPPPDPPPDPLTDVPEPPALTAPVTINVTTAGINKQNLDPLTDYIIQLPTDAPVTGNIRLVGGHHIVIVGGEITPVAGSLKSSNGHFNLFISDYTGTLHVEGIKCSPGVVGGTGTGFENGVAVGDVFRHATSSRTSRVQIVNCNFINWPGTQAGFHNDGFQTWQGPQTLVIDGLKVKGTYQCLLLQPSDSPSSGIMWGDYEFRNIHVMAHKEIILGNTYTAAYAVAGGSFNRVEAENCYIEETGIGAPRRGALGQMNWNWQYSIGSAPLWDGWAYGAPPVDVLTGRGTPGYSYDPYVIDDEPDPPPPPPDPPEEPEYDFTNPLTPFSEDYTGEADGTVVSKTNTAWTAFVSGTMTFQSTGPSSGAGSMRAVCDGAKYARRTQSPNADGGFFRFYMRFVNAALGGDRAVFYVGTSAGGLAVVRANSSRKIIWTCDAYQTSSHALALGTWCRIEGVIDSDNDYSELRLFNLGTEADPDSTTPTEVFYDTANGGISWDRAQIGLISSDISGGIVEFAEFATADDDWIGPAS